MKRVLLLSGHNLFRESLALTFERDTDFMEIVQAPSVAEARRVLDDSFRNLDLAIVDLNLANEGSFDLIKDLRMTHLDVPVLALTRGLDAHRRDRALRAGAGGVLTLASPLKDIVEVAKRFCGES
jgi:two-component system invasion response regulator UvrY